jgi:peptidoglycan hydrolase-like protein with peptidoglycan-binding domain
MTLSRQFNLMMASVVSFSIAATPMLGVGVAHAQSAPAAEAPGDTGWQREFDVWRAASKSNTAADYQIYLRAYPAGKFAAVAKTRIDDLSGIKTAKDSQTEIKTTDTAQADAKATETSVVRSTEAGEDEAEKKRDLEMWRQVSKTGLVADYQKYLKAFPKGKFAKVAKTRVDSLIAAAKAPAEQPAVADTSETKQAPADDQAQADQAQADQAQADQTQADEVQKADQATVDEAKPADQAKTTQSDWEQEYALWKAASDGNTVVEYEAYLKAYPNGKFAAIAQARIVQLAAAEQPAANVDEGDNSQAEQTSKVKPDQSADDQNQASDDQNQAADDQNQPADDQGQTADSQMDDQGQQSDTGPVMQNKQKVVYSEGTPDTEDALLNRERRHEMQGRLTSIGYDTFGSDGSFGPNTRNAIGAWQQNNGAPVSGYLSGDQIAQIRIQSQVAYAQWLAAHPVVVERPIVVVRPRREKVIVEERNPGVDAAIAIGVLGAVVGAHRFGRIKGRPGRIGAIGRFKLGGCRKHRVC